MTRPKPEPANIVHPRVPSATQAKYMDGYNYADEMRAWLADGEWDERSLAKISAGNSGRLRRAGERSEDASWSLNINGHGVVTEWDRPDQLTRHFQAKNAVLETDEDRCKRLEAHEAAYVAAIAEGKRLSAEVLVKSKLAQGDHPYLAKKGITAAYLYQEDGSRGRLIVPIHAPDGDICALQYIDETGQKRNLSGAPIPLGSYAEIPGTDQSCVLIVEGWATGKVTSEAIGGKHSVRCTMGARNIASACRIAAQDYPSKRTRFVIVADADAAGQTGAKEALAELQTRGRHAVMVTPTFAADHQGERSDFADLPRDQVKPQIEAVLTAGAERLADWPGPMDFGFLNGVSPASPRFVIPHGWLPEGYPTLLAGHGGAGKSSISMHLVVCIAMGLNFFGLPVQRRRVLLLNCEDQLRDIHFRLARICDHLRIKVADLKGNLEVYPLIGAQSILWAPDPKGKGEHRTAAYYQLERTIEEHSSQVIVMDGVTDTFGGNENSRTEVKQFVNDLIALTPLDGALLLIAHVNKVTAGGNGSGENYSGSTAWHNAARARWYLDVEYEDDAGRKEKTGRLILRLQKSNFGPSDQEMEFAWDDQAHMFVGRLLGGVSPVSVANRDHAEQQAIYAALKALNASGVTAPASRGARRNAQNVLAVQPLFPDTLKRKSRITTDRFWSHIEVLLASCLIREVTITKSNRHKVDVLEAV